MSVVVPKLRVRDDLRCRTILCETDTKISNPPVLIINVAAILQSKITHAQAGEFPTNWRSKDLRFLFGAVPAGGRKDKFVFFTRQQNKRLSSMEIGTKGELFERGRTGQYVGRRHRFMILVEHSFACTNGHLASHQRGVSAEADESYQFRLVR